LREPVAAAIDDELAKALGFDDLNALRASVREQIEKDYGAIARNRLKRELLDKLAEAHDFEVPSGLVDTEFETIWRQIEADREQGRMDPEDEGKSEEELKAEYRELARRRVKL